jgi:tRNA pseudouridine55 synthase
VTPPAEGLLLVDKPPGPTSHDIVSLVRRGCRLRRVGHTGTLDPMATGLLPLVLGRATRLARFLPDSPKQYRGRLLLGRSTTTDDVTGELLREHGSALPSPDRVLAGARGLLGRRAQEPPVFSARRVGGRRLYDLAREGQPTRAPAREVEIRRFELSPTDSPGLYAFEAEVSAGTYIRALARDLGRELGCGGTLASLTRTGIGPLRLEQARPLPTHGPDPAWLAEALIPLERMPLDPPSLVLDSAERALRFRRGTAVPLDPRPATPGARRVLDSDGSLLGIGEIVGDRLHPKVVLPPLGPATARR